MTDLSRANNDMNNLLAGTGVGTVFVDLDLRISRFTPAATHIINLIQTDVGRPVGHIVSNLAGYDRLVEDIRRVLDSLVIHEAELQTKSGDWYLMRIRPYRTLENVIEGAVITFVDITERKGMEKTIDTHLAQLAQMTSWFDNAPVGQAVLDRDLRYLLVNKALAEINGLPVAAHIGKTVSEIVPTLAGKAKEVTAEILRSGNPVAEIEFEGETAWRPGVTRTWQEGWYPLKDKEGMVNGFSVMVRDITEHKRQLEDLNRNEKRLEDDLKAMTHLHRIGTLFLAAGDMKVVLDEIVEAAIAITGADMGNIQLVDPRSGALKIRVQRGFEQSWVDFWDDHAARGQGACGAALEKGDRVIVEDIAKSPIFGDKALLDVQLAAGVRAVQSTPLISSKGTLMGMFSTHFRIPHRPDERALNLLDVLARQTADILEHGEVKKGGG